MYDTIKATYPLKKPFFTIQWLPITIIDCVSSSHSITALRRSSTSVFLDEGSGRLKTQETKILFKNIYVPCMSSSRRNYKY